MKIMKIILIFNFIILFINIFIIIKNKLLKSFYYKNVDFKNLLLNTFYYKNISDYLNSQYEIKLQTPINLTKLNYTALEIQKKKISLYFVDFLLSRFQKYQIKKIIVIFKFYEI